MRLLPVLTAAASGVMAAPGGYTFLYARGHSYLTNNPRACANCHITLNHHEAATS